MLPRLEAPGIQPLPRFNDIAGYAFSYFVPAILKDGFGYSTGRAQFLRGGVKRRKKKAVNSP
jgi:hypothetical protein